MNWPTTKQEADEQLKRLSKAGLFVFERKVKRAMDDMLKFRPSLGKEGEDAYGVIWRASLRHYGRDVLAEAHRRLEALR